MGVGASAPVAGDAAALDCVGEVSDLPNDDHPAASAVVTHKDGMGRELAALLTEIGVPDPEQRAHVVLMLLDGAAVHSVIRGNGHLAFYRAMAQISCGSESAPISSSTPSRRANDRQG